MDELHSREIQGLLEEDEPTRADLWAERALPVETWPGITASASGYVKHLYLERNSLSGTCPDYFTHFTRITALSLGECTAAPHPRPRPRSRPCDRCRRASARFAIDCRFCPPYLSTHETPRLAPPPPSISQHTTISAGRSARTSGLSSRSRS